MNKRRDQKSIFEEADEDTNVYGFEPDVPWNLWRTRLDILNSFNPVDSLRYFYLPHSTGFSYAFLLATFALAAIFTAFVFTRYTDDDRIDFSARRSYVMGEELYLPEMGFVLQKPTGVNGTLEAVAFNSSLIVFEWETCLSRETEVASQVTVSCETLASRTCTFPDEDGDSSTQLEMQCAELVNVESGLSLDEGKPRPGTRVQGSPENDAEWRFSRMTVRRCRESDSVACGAEAASDAMWADSRLATRLYTVPEFDLREQSVVRVVKSFSHSTVPSLSLRIMLHFQVVTVEDLARWLVDGDETSEPMFDRFRTEYAERDNDVYAVVVMQLRPNQLFRYYRVVSIVEVLSKCMALYCLLWLLGIIAREYNRVHFRWFGQFKAAQLPTRYIDHVFDPHVPIRTPGVRNLAHMHHRTKRGVMPHEFSRLHYRIGNTREALEKLVHRQERARRPESALAAKKSL